MLLLELSFTNIVLIPVYYIGQPHTHHKDVFQVNSYIISSYNVTFIKLDFQEKNLNLDLTTDLQISSLVPLTIELS